MGEAIYCPGTAAACWDEPRGLDGSSLAAHHPAARFLSAAGRTALGDQVCATDLIEPLAHRPQRETLFVDQ